MRSLATNTRFALAPLLALAYVVAYPQLFAVAHEAVAALMVVPITVAAWQFGARGGYAMAVAMAVANTYMFTTHAELLGESLVESVVTGVTFAGVGRVIDQVRVANRRVADLTFVDQLTRLPNIKAFRRHVESAIAGSPAAHVALAEISALRDVKESFGDEVGEELVKEIARRLRVGLEGRAFVSRFELDTFAVAVTSGIGSDEWLGTHILDAFRAPFIVAGGMIAVEGHVGLARYPEHGATESDVIHAAEAALNVARRSSSGWSASNAERRNEAVTRLATVTALRAALEHDELTLHYQPLLNITDGKVRGFEALLRWNRDGQMVPPMQFIPLAEQSGLIVPLTEWVIESAIVQIAAWNAAGQRTRVAVNVGAKCFAAGADVASVIARLLAKHGVDASQLGVEVTETDIMNDPDQAIATLRSLKDLGLSISLDDFGTGYSSLAYLNQLPLDEVKIDRSFIQRLARDASTSAIVRAAVDLSHALGLDALAEGVEDQATLDRLTVIGCDFAQGYLIAKPMPADRVMPWFSTHLATRAVVSAPVQAPRTADAPTALDIATVMVIDDEHSLRVATHRMLSGKGYRVLHAATASEALRICTEEGKSIDLIVSDIFLTDWRGHELAERIRATYPHIKFLFVSGDPKAAELVEHEAFLAKPFSKQQLVERVAGVLVA
jgi:predicted signal transduction protein with EAL and GGDEF domain/CheY-like chemotaxis protein